MQLDHRKLAVEFNQRTWALIDDKLRSADEAEEMVMAAFASLAHWLKAGTGVNHHRGEWLIARAYAELGRAEPALHHLYRTEALTQAHRAESKDFDFAFLEALAARILALANDHEQASKRYAQAVALGEAIVNAEDRKGFFEQLHEEPWFGLERRS
jgi:hypothetical protein